jgi:hypothetical protein
MPAYAYAAVKRVRSVELDQQFSELRRRRDVAPRTTISEAEIKRIVAKAIAARMKADEEGRMLGLSEADYTRHLKWLEESEKSSSEAVAGAGP